LQAQILNNARLALRPGGRLVFATCSVLPEEGQAVLESVAEWLEAGPPLGGTLGNKPDGTPGEGLPFGGARTFRVTPDLADADGYFLASLAARPGV
jgi:16S rRNA (cytosine967-C5)-methyltransferase